MTKTDLIAQVAANTEMSKKSAEQAVNAVFEALSKAMSEGEKITISGFGTFEQYADRMDAIARVFPVFFFLVAALVATTTMTRMVDENRLQLGTLKALGYSNAKIAGKYLFYALSASVLGSIVGMVIADTAGRLHNKANLMAELSKISRSVKKASPEASLETLLVLDAITGQNAISQAKEFCKAADATGIILTKLDGTAKGGCVVAVKQRLGLPVRFIGVGEGIDDLLPFTPEGFVEELLPRQWKH